MTWKTTPYGFKETEYKGFTITKSDGTYYPKGYSVEFYGDIVTATSLDDAKKMIDKEVGDVK